MIASEMNTLWYDPEFEEKLTQLLEGYSGELMTEADGALGKTTAAIVYAKARQINKQILHNYTCVGDINDAVIEQLDDLPPRWSCTPWRKGRNKLGKRP